MIGRASKDKAKKPSAGNQKRIIKRLAAETIIVLLICGAIGGVAYFLSDMAAEEKKKSDESETEVLQLSGKAQTLKTQMEQFVDALPLSKRLLNDRGESTQTLSRELASDVFLALRDKYVLEDVKVDISPIERMEDAAVNKNHVQLIRSTIRIEMKAYTDEDVAAYTQDVINELPGMVSTQSIKMTRGKEYSLSDSEGAENINLNEPQIEAQINFIWYGFDVKEKQGGEQ